jgi:hypothetical protein
MTVDYFKPFVNYPIRPPVLTGESLSGYIYRVLTLNGHKVPKVIYKELISYCSEKPERAVQSQFILRSLLGDKFSLEFSDWLEHWQLIRNHYHIGGEYIKTLQLCPYCLEEVQIHFSLWAFPLVVACPEHRCMLLSRCYFCSRPLCWIDLKPGWRCKCGASIQRAPVSNAGPDLVTLAKLVASARDINLPEKLKRRWANDLTFNRYDLEELFYLLEGPYRYLITNASPYLSQNLLKQLESH